MHQEVITSEAKEIFDKLKNFPEFYLGGGTALALQIGHRISVDFDLFWENYIPKELLPKIRRIFRSFKVNIVVNHSEQLTVAVDDINISFIRYPFLVISKLIRYQGIKILPVLEIGAMKAYALGRRATLKDYIDLYFILKEKRITLEKIIKLCEKKYKDEFDPRLFLEQLLYLEDVEEIKIQFLKKKVGREEIQKFFEAEIKKLKII